MTPQFRSASGPGPAGRAAALLLAAGCTALATTSLVEVARARLALAVLMPSATPWMLAALALSTTAAAVALVATARALRRPPGAPGPHLPWRVAGCVVVAAVVVHVACFQPYRPLVARVTLAVAAGLVALLMLAGRRMAAAVPRRALAVADLLACALALAAVAGEVALTVLADTSRSPLFARAHESVDAYVDRFRLDPRDGSADFPVNAGGHFDTAFHAAVPGTPLAVCIGDSFSTSVVPHAFHFTTVAERALQRGEIHNMGFAGIGLNIYLHLLATEAVPLRPDVIVVDLFVGNDLAEGLEDVHPAGWLQRCMDGEHLLVPQVGRRLLRLASAGQHDARPLDGVGAGAGSARGGDATRARTPAELERDIPSLADPRLEVPGYAEAAFADLEALRAQAVCRTDAPPAWGLVFERLASLRAACGDIPFAVMVIPDEFQVEDDVWDAVRRAPGSEHLDRDLPQRELHAWLSAQGIPTLDLLPALRAVPPMEDGRRHLYHLRDTHFNARGNGVAGRELAAFLATWWR